MIEEWIDIKGFEGKYQISSNGRVRSLDRITVDSIGRSRLYKGQIMKPFVNGSGYLQLNLSLNGIKYNPFLHKLIAEHFISNPNNYPEVNHINHNKLDCSIENLEWCTRKENMIKASEFYRKNPDKTKIKFSHPIIETCVDCNNIISKGSKRCKSCSNVKKNTRKVKERPTKEELLNLVKNNSFLKVGKMFNVSDNAIRKWCKEYDIPHRKKDLNAK